MKKTMSLFLAMLMCMALAVPVFADDPNRTLKYGVAVQEPTIDVEIPTASQSVILNPYKIKVTEAAIGAADAQGSVLSAKFYMQNKSTVPLSMSVTATGAIPAGSGATFSTSAPADTEKAKKVFLFLDIGATVTEGAAPTTAALADSTLTYDPTNTKQAVIKAGESKMTNVLTIPTPRAVATGNYVTIQIGGACAPSPTEAWAAADKVDLSLVFTFQAASNTAS